MKNLANCTPREFLRQTNRIRKAAKEWLTLTDIMNIRRRMPNIPDTATEDERRAALEAQMTENINAMLEMILEKYPDETAEMLGLLCFVEPDDLDKHPMTEFLGAFNEIINSREVIDFFTSLASLGSRNTFAHVKA